MSATTTTQTEIPISQNARKAFVLIAFCFTLSGAAGLIYEVLWSRMLGLVFGATTVAISVVLTAFMGGLALGGAMGGKIADKSKNAVRTYALIEIAIGLSAIGLPFMFRIAGKVDASVWQTVHPGSALFALLRFMLAGAVLLIPTMLMGATLPIIVTGIRQSGDARLVAISRLYGLNLLGAILGTVLAGFFLLPWFGVRATIWIAAVVNFLVGVVALWLSQSANDSARTLTGPSSTRDANSNNVDQEALNGSAFWFACALCSGFVTIGMQVIWSRVLSMIIGSSTYAFALVLTLFLFGLCLGAWLLSFVGTSDSRQLRRVVFGVQLMIVVALFMSLRLTSAVPGLMVSMGFRFGMETWRGLLSLQALAAIILMLIPSAAMGVIMPAVLTWAGRHRSSNSGPAITIGKAYALNTVGAIGGAIITTFVLIPRTSSRFAWFCMAAISLSLAAIAYQPRRERSDISVMRGLSIGVAAIAMVAMLFIWPRLNLNELSVGAYDSFIRVLAKARGGAPENDNGRPDDHALLMYEEGRTATVSVRRDWGITSVAINGRTNASDADDMPTQVMLGHLGVLTAPRLDNALIIGFATGVTAGSVLQSPVQTVEGVEIEPAAIDSSRFFEKVNHQPLNDPRLRMIVDDARTRLRVNPVKYDLIVSEPSHPWVPGVANLFTREFFELGRERLFDDGVFVQWLQIYQLSNANLRSVLATFHEVFPHVTVFRIGGAAKGKDLILIGSRAPVRLDLISERMKDNRIANDLKRIGLNSPTDLMAWFVCDESRLAAAIQGAVINTDDNMHVETVAPREAFRPAMEENSKWIEELRVRN